MIERLQPFKPVEKQFPGPAGANHVAIEIALPDAVARVSTRKLVVTGQNSLEKEHVA